MGEHVESIIMDESDDPDDDSDMKRISGELHAQWPAVRTDVVEPSE